MRRAGCAAPRVSGGERAVLTLAGYLAAVVVVAGVLSVPLFGALRALGLDPPFHDLTLRTAELTALAGALVWLRLLGAGREALGLGGRPALQLREGLLGLGLGVASIGVVIGLVLALGARVLRPEASLASLPGYFAAGLLVGLAVALIEELWLRGGLLGALARYRPWPALWLTSGLYAVVHFVRADEPIDALAVHWWSGFVVLAGSLGRLANPGIVDSLLALLAAGVLLARLRLGCRGLAVCVGTHAGWVAGIYAARRLTETEAGPAAWLVGGYDGVIGWLAFAVFGLTALAAHRILPPPAPRAEAPSATALGPGPDPTDDWARAGR